MLPAAKVPAAKASKRTEILVFIVLLVLICFDYKCIGETIYLYKSSVTNIGNASIQSKATS